MRTGVPPFGGLPCREAVSEGARSRGAIVCPSLRHGFKNRGEGSRRRTGRAGTGARHGPNPSMSLRSERLGGDVNAVARDVARMVRPTPRAGSGPAGRSENHRAAIFRRPRSGSDRRPPSFSSGLSTVFEPSGGSSQNPHGMGPWRRRRLPVMLAALHRTGEGMPVWRSDEARIAAPPPAAARAVFRPVACRLRRLSRSCRASGGRACAPRSAPPRRWSARAPSAPAAAARRHRLWPRCRQSRCGGPLRGW